MHGISLEIITRLMIARKDDGKLFRNRRGTAWAKHALCNRFHRLSQKTGKRMFCHLARHGWATRKRIQGHGHFTFAGLMGHSDGSMIAKVYSHIDKDDVHPKRALVD